MDEQNEKKQGSNQKNIVILVLLLVVLIGGSFLAYNALLGSGLVQREDTLTPIEEPSSVPSEPPDEAETGDGAEAADNLAPDFTVLDHNGSPVRLSDLRGKPVVLNFWASWCGPCRGEMPEFDAACVELGDSVHFMMVNLTDGMQETQEAAEAFIAEAGYTFPVYFDTEQEAAYQYNVMSIPTTYFIDAEGKLVTKSVGAISAEQLHKGIGMITDGKQ